ncbi:unnamed protein product, partial [Ectocarpus fasciculatus]
MISSLSPSTTPTANDSASSVAGASGRERRSKVSRPIPSKTIEERTTGPGLGGGVATAAKREERARQTGPGKAIYILHMHMHRTVQPRSPGFWRGFSRRSGAAFH